MGSPSLRMVKAEGPAEEQAEPFFRLGTARIAAQNNGPTDMQTGR